MARLTDTAKAYNALTDILNDRDEKLAALLEERNRVWDALNSLYPGIGHGKGNASKARLALK